MIEIEEHKLSASDFFNDDLQLTVLWKQESHLSGVRAVRFNQRATGVLQECLKRTIPDYLVGTLTYFPLNCQVKYDNSQHKNSCPLWMNQNYTYFC